MASIVINGPPAPGLRFPLTLKREFVIGRSVFCDIVLNKRSISREHARILEQEGSYYLEDLGSANGTSVNGRRVRDRVQLNDCDRINMYDVPMTFCLFDDSKPPSSGTIPTFGDVHHDDGSHQKLQTRLEDLLDIIRRLGSSLNVEIILPKVLEILFHTFPGAMSGEIILVGNDGRMSPHATKHGRDGMVAADVTSVPPDRRMTQQVMETSCGLIDSVGDDSGESALESSFASTMYVPMIGTTGKPLGIIVLETEDPVSRFDEDDLNLVSGVAMIAAQAVSYARAHEKVVEHERTRYQFDIASKIQRRMLPRECPLVPGYQFAHYYRAAQMVGGDAYIYQALSDGRVAIAVADASGKGLPAALRIAEFIAELRHCISTATSLKSAMSYLNQFVCRTDEGFITFCLAILDPKHHTLSIANAGHPPPRLRHADASVISAGSDRVSFPLGVDPDTQFHPITISVHMGDEFVMFTDGVSEAFNSKGEIFGTNRLDDALLVAVDKATARVQQLVASVDHYCRGARQSDDQCIVAMARGAKPPTDAT
ncbi:MAG: Serine phosphatase RsbU, regulator of sigma subunit [Planctomycetaceae bacterium]|nr:Serine phosphatase RsbU, regulator of sigma subunit [Planctomycetaceae bacterium]